MTKLLSANLVRLRKSIIFWVGIIFMAGIAAFILINQYLDSVKYGLNLSLDSFILGYSVIIGIVAAVFCSLFLGTEYSDGTIRNKLIVGHTRISIYLSMLITSIIAALLMCLSFLMVMCAVGIPLIGFVSIDIWRLSAMLLGSLLMVCAVCSILTAISMLVPNKALAAVISILGMIGLLLIAIDIQQKLDAPEFYPAQVYIEDGNMTMSEEVVNPTYITGIARLVYAAILDIIQSGQAFQYASMSAVHLWQMPLYSLAIVILSTIAGIIFFNRKDIK